MGFITASEARAMAPTQEQLNEALVEKLLAKFDEKVRAAISKRKTEVRFGADVTLGQHALLEAKLKAAEYTVRVRSCEDDDDEDSDTENRLYIVSW
ncbi:hypothetical protein [Burkholderia phage BCSR5]|nr:hypothetical protein [Burkholderia phage BCSR5]